MPVQLTGNRACALRCYLPSGRFVLQRHFTFEPFWDGLDGRDAALAVVLYIRSQRPAWITIGAGARHWTCHGTSGSMACFWSERRLAVLAAKCFARAEPDRSGLQCFCRGISKKHNDSIAGMNLRMRRRCSLDCPHASSCLSPEGHAGYMGTFNRMKLSVSGLVCRGRWRIGPRFQARRRRPESRY